MYACVLYKNVAEIVKKYAKKNRKGQIFFRRQLIHENGTYNPTGLWPQLLLVWGHNNLDKGKNLFI